MIITETLNGDIILTGSTSGSASTELGLHFIVIRVDGDGELFWIKELTEVGIGGASALAEGPGSSVYVGGPSAIFKLNQDGEVVWKSEINGTVNHILPMEDGTLWAGGHVNVIPEISHMLLLKLDENGNVLLRRQY